MRVDDQACFRAHNEHCEVHPTLQPVLDQITEQFHADLLTIEEYVIQLISISAL